MKIAIAGGTGVVGAHTVAAVRAAGHEPVVLARSAGVDIIAGTGLDAALDGVAAVIDVANVFATRAKPAVQFFETGTRNLIEAGKAHGVTHHVVLSIVGIDLVEYGYYAGKRAQEKTALDSGAPVSILRATQFHEFPGQVLDRAKGPIAIMPRMRVQTVAASEVGEVLVALAVGTPVGRAPDLAGPQERQLTDLARLVLDKRGSKKALWKVTVPGAAGKAMRSGALIPADGTRGVISFDQWLAGGSV
jgi:uncharacterized protein YbjT (DUF2867 family)